MDESKILSRIVIIVISLLIIITFLIKPLQIIVMKTYGNGQLDNKHVMMKYLQQPKQSDTIKLNGIISR